jgi:toxin YhaV
MSPDSATPLVVHGWTVFAHPVFLSQLEALGDQVETLRQKDPAGFAKKNASKRLAALYKLAFDVIPQDPARPEYRQGNALGDDRRHWFRAKFFQQYRLFFRFHAKSKVIVFAWVNDEATLRAYESNDDAYRVFRRMLEGGALPKQNLQPRPPQIPVANSWLLQTDETAVRRITIPFTVSNAVNAWRIRRLQAIMSA